MRPAGRRVINKAHDALSPSKSNNGWPPVRRADCAAKTLLIPAHRKTTGAWVVISSDA
jgi:hypothetical protein